MKTTGKISYNLKTILTTLAIISKDTEMTVFHRCFAGGKHSNHQAELNVNTGGISFKFFLQQVSKDSVQRVVVTQATKSVPFHHCKLYDALTQSRRRVWEGSTHLEEEGMWALHKLQYLSFMEHHGMASDILLSFAIQYPHFCPLQRVSAGMRSLERGKEREPGSVWVENRATRTGVILERFIKANGSSEWGCWERVMYGERRACPCTLIQAPEFWDCRFLTKTSFISHLVGWTNI